MAEGPGRLIVGQYRLVEEIGRGGFGVVWRAWDERLGRSVAAKQMHLPDHLGGDQLEARRRRALREARSAARIDHPSAVTVFEVIEHDEIPWIIMEFVDGPTLSALVRKEGPLPPRRVAEMGLAILGALRAAHAAGVVHRDVKPANVMMGDGRVVLTDFGIATIEGDVSLTHSGYVMGAPAYTAPERARGEAAVPASDLWSLGATLFYAVEGRRPFEGDNPNAVFHAILNGEAPKPKLAGLLGPIIQSLLRANVRDRITAEQTSYLLQDVANDRVPLLRSITDSPRAPVPLTYDYGRQQNPKRLRLIIAATAAIGLIAGLLWTSNAADAPPRGRAQVPPSPTSPRLLASLAAGGKLYTVAISPDGRTLAAAGENRGVHLWNLADRRPLTTLRGHHNAVFTAAFSPDSRTLATGGYDADVLLWNTAARRKVATLAPDQGTVGALAFSPDGRRLATAGSDDVQLWNIGTKSRVKTFGRSEESQFLTAFSKLGWLAIASTDALRMWRPKASPQSSTLGAVASLVRSMAFDPAGRVVAVGGDDGTVTFWDCLARKRLGTVRHNQSVYAVAFSPSGQTLATASGGTVTLWNVADRRRTATLRARSALVGSLAFNRSGGTLAVGGYDGKVELWSL